MRPEGVSDTGLSHTDGIDNVSEPRAQMIRPKPFNCTNPKKIWRQYDAEDYSPSESCKQDEVAGYVCVSNMESWIRQDPGDLREFFQETISDDSER